MNVGSRWHGQRFLWMSEPASPFVRFQRVSERRLLVWVAASDTLDIQDLDIALKHGAGPGGIVRSFIRFAGYELSAVEDELLTRYRVGDTGPDFWAAVAAAGLTYEPPAVPSHPRSHPPPQSAAPIPFSTAGPFVALTKALTRTSPGDWHESVDGMPRESRYTFAGFRIRLATGTVAGTVSQWFPEGAAGVADDLVELIERYGGQKATLTLQACTQLAARRPGEPIDFDQIMYELAYKRPSGRVDGPAHKRAAKREVYGRILLGQWATAVGDIKRTVDGRTAGYEAWALYAIDHVSFDSDGTPAAITFLPAGLSRLIADNPAFLEYLGNMRDVLALPETTPGRWAAAILYAVRLHWRLNLRYAKMHANTGGERRALEFPPITRRQLFAVMQPDPPTLSDVLTGRDPRRAITYFDEAMRILLGRRKRATGPSHVSYCRALPTWKARDGREPWELVAPGSKPRVSQWREPWLEQHLDVRPGGADLSELLSLYEHVRLSRRGLWRRRVVSQDHVAEIGT